MADRSLRGMRLGSQSMQSEEGVVFADRVLYDYRCMTCNADSTIAFAIEAEAPEEWGCCGWGEGEVLLVNSEPIHTNNLAEKPPRTHWDMLLERRTVEELEALLAERLDILRERRGTATPRTEVQAPRVGAEESQLA